MLWLCQVALGGSLQGSIKHSTDCCSSRALGPWDIDPARLQDIDFQEVLLGAVREQGSS